MEVLHDLALSRPSATAVMCVLPGEHLNLGSLIRLSLLTGQHQLLKQSQLTGRAGLLLAVACSFPSGCLLTLRGHGMQALLAEHACQPKSFAHILSTAAFVLPERCSLHKKSVLAHVNRHDLPDGVQGLSLVQTHGMPIAAGHL